MAQYVEHSNPGEAFFPVSGAKSDVVKLSKTAGEYSKSLISRVLGCNPAIGHYYNEGLFKEKMVDGVPQWDTSKLKNLNNQTLLEVLTRVENFEDAAKDGNNPTEPARRSK